MAEGKYSIQNDHKNQLLWITNILMTAQKDGFYGKIEISLKAGDIDTVEKTESLKYSTRKSS